MATEGSSVFGSTKELRSAVARAYLATGHGYKASGKGGGRQKKYSCSGVAEPPKPKQETSKISVASPVICSACTTEVRATKSVLDEWRVTYADFEHANNCSEGNARVRPCGIDQLVKATLLCANPAIGVTNSVLDEWRVTHADFEHANCSEGNARVRICGIDPLAKATLCANPHIGVKALRQTIQQETGVPVSVSTATRARSNILLTDATEVAKSYHYLPGYFQVLSDASYRECFS